jgi:peptide/nickel transport system permease protein
MKLVGLVLILFWVGVALLSAVWTPFDPHAPDFIPNLPPLSGPNLLGTDHLGRDILSRLMQGVQVLLLKTRLGDLPLPGGVLIWGALAASSVGAMLGLKAGGRAEWLLRLLSLCPQVVLCLAVIAALGRSDLVVILALTVAGAPGVAQRVRASLQTAKAREKNGWHVWFGELRRPLLVEAMIRAKNGVLILGLFGFLGLGLLPPEPDWGNMLGEARKSIVANPWAVVWPTLAMTSLVIGLNLFADGLGLIYSLNNSPTDTPK